MARSWPTIWRQPSPPAMGGHALQVCDGSSGPLTRPATGAVSRRAPTGAATPSTTGTTTIIYQEDSLMTIHYVVSTKGGSGKTHVATLLAHLLPDPAVIEHVSAADASPAFPEDARVVTSFAT